MNDTLKAELEALFARYSDDLTNLGRLVDDVLAQAPPPDPRPRLGRGARGGALMAKEYVIYDARALTQPTDDCAVLEACGSLNEVQRTTWDGRRDPLGVVAEYDVVPRAGKNWLENERILGTVPQVKAGAKRRGSR